MPSSSMKKDVKSPEQKENDRHPENNAKDNEIYNLNDDDFIVFGIVFWVLIIFLLFWRFNIFFHTA